MNLEKIQKERYYHIENFSSHQASLEFYTLIILTAAPLNILDPSSANRLYERKHVSKVSRQGHCHIYLSKPCLRALHSFT